MPRKAVIQEDGDLDSVMYILAYDVPSENIKHLKKHEKQFLEAMRFKVRAQLRRKRCALLQKSLWRVPEETLKDYTDSTGRIVPGVESLAAAWLTEYAASGFPALIRVFPIGTNEVGYTTLIEMQVDSIKAWLSSIQTILDASIDEGKITQKKLSDHKKNVNALDTMIETFFGPHAVDYDKDIYKDLSSEIKYSQQSLMEVERTVRVIKPTKAV
jgi:hypothetical protein